MSSPERYKVTIIGTLIISVGPKVVLDDLEEKAEKLGLDSIDEIILENKKTKTVVGRRKVQVH